MDYEDFYMQESRGVVFSRDYIEDDNIVDAWFKDNEDRDLIELNLNGEVIEYSDLEKMYGRVVEKFIFNMANDAF